MSFRCEDGWAMRHTPEHNDPYQETRDGACPKCNGEGCDAKFRREADRSLADFDRILCLLGTLEREMETAWKRLPADALNYTEEHVGPFDLPTREVECTVAFMRGHLARLDNASARSPYVTKQNRDGSDWVPLERRREHAAWLAGNTFDADDGGAALPSSMGAAA